MMKSAGSDMQVQGQAAITCAVCFGVGVMIIIWWWLQLQRRQWRRLYVKEVVGSDAAAVDVKCNDPNCLRCHSSSSQLHIQAFQSNVILLRRLVKLEPNLFKGMREEIWSVIDDILNRSSTSAAMHHQHQESSMIMSFFYGARSSSLSYPSPSSLLSTTSTTQAGQNPTVFFLPGLETTPLHDENYCPARDTNCPCLRLRKTEKIENSSDDEHEEIIRSKKKLRPTLSMTGDINALQNGFDIIRRELMEFLSHNDSANTTNNEDNINCNSKPDHDQSSKGERIFFQPFDPKVYTHARARQQQQQQQPKPEWSSVYLYHRGVRQSNICDKYFPQTMHILETQCSHRMAGKCGLGSVYFSKLGRNTKVKEHCGPTNVRWRCHLPLIVPQTCTSDSSRSSSFLRVGLAGVNERCVGWKEGKPILFDDSFLHSAVHYGGDIDNAKEANSNLEGARIVLIIDFWHPSLSEMDRTALGVLYPPGI